MLCVSCFDLSYLSQRALSSMCLMISLVLFITGNLASSEGQIDVKRVLESAGPNVTPTVYNPVEVIMALALTSIREVDTVRGEVEITAMRSISWVKPPLHWESSYSVDTKHLWMPDIVAYNAVHSPELLSPPLAAVAADGTINYVPNERVRFRCDLRKFETISGSNCTLVYGSWTYDAARISLRLEESTVSTEDFNADPRFDLLNTYAEVKVKQYPCCIEKYTEVRFTLNIRKKRSSSFRMFSAWGR